LKRPQLGIKADPVVALPPLRLTATSEELTRFHAYLEEFWGKLPQGYSSALNEQWQMLFTTAAAEIISNIITHAYGRSDCPGWIDFHLSLYTDCVTGEFTDRGIYWNGQLGPNLPSAVDIPQMAESGRGMHIIQAATDELKYWRSNDDENHWLVVKKFSQ